MSERTRAHVDWEERPLRSLLFAPGNHPRKLEKVGGFGSDAIVLDLEDAVADAEKSAARETVRAALPTYGGPTGNPQPPTPPPPTTPPPVTGPPTPPPDPNPDPPPTANPPPVPVPAPPPPTPPPGG